MSAAGAALVKCVVWDLDNTLLDGVYLESGDQPPAADPALAGLLAELGGRGILHAIASKNPPDAAAYAQQVTGCRFAAAECGWDRKPDALNRIAAQLNIGVESLAFVDDDPYERAEVAAALPRVLVLSPEEVADAAGWPEFRPVVVTDEARRRGELYAQRRRRQEAELAFGGSPEEFLRSAGTRVTIAAATAADAPRLHELAVRTHQFNSLAGVAAAGEQTQAWFRSQMSSGDSDVFTVRLRDNYGDDGLVGGCVVVREPAGTWTVRLLLMSCRAMGRGVIGALLAWLVRQAARDGARSVTIGCVLSDRNVPLRLALASAGFRVAAADGGGAAGAQTAAVGVDGPRQARQVSFRRDLTGPVPDLPGWVSAPGERNPGPA